ncbi:MAG: winged helix-turn-helix transcriptional regulator [Erysipelotrichales bacterium]|nr:winged helix-turn-helix transcriptional regulator [Erysipelotrichales bacterium]
MNPVIKEFEKINKHIGDAVVAFLNSNGGTIKVSLQTPKDFNKIQTILKEITPFVRLNQEITESEAILYIPAGLDKPYCNERGFFVFEKQLIYKLTRDELINKIKQEGIRANYQYFSDVDVDSVFSNKLFQDFLEKSSEFKEEDLFGQLLGLKAMHNLNNQYFFRLAGLLCFTNYPQDYLQNAFIQINVFNGSNKALPIDSIDFKGNLLEMIDKAYKFLKDKLKVSDKLIWELLLNMVLHNDYHADCLPMVVEIYADKAIFRNLRTIHPILDQHFGIVSFSSDQGLKNILKTIGYVRNIGAGIDIVNAELEKNNLPPITFERNEFFSAYISLIEQKEKIFFRVKGKPREKIGKFELKSRQIYSEIVKNPFITQSELFVKTEISERTISRIIQELRSKGKIIRIGANKNGYWEIAENKIREKI